MQIEIRGSTYEYNVHGSGPPLVLFHGFTGSSNTWSPFISKWEIDFTIVTVDLPGHGKTKMNTPYTIESCCEELKVLFQSIGLESFHLAGYSMGGRIALSFSMYYPEMIETLILESSTAGIDSDHERIQRRSNDEQWIKEIETKGVEHFVHMWENIPLFATQKRLPKVVQQNIRKERLSQSKEGLSDSLRYIGTGTMPSWWKKLSEFKQPVLLITGQLDQKFVMLNKQMEKEFPYATLEIVENAGHAVHVEQAEVFCQLVSNFIKNRRC